MSRLFIAEKKIAGETLAAYLSKTSGIPMSSSPLYIKVGNDTVAWLSGHVLELVAPEVYNPKYKNRDDFTILPIIPEKFELTPTQSGERIIANIRNLIKQNDSICHFGDPDREGQLIVDEVLNYLKNTKPVTRLWTSSLNDSGLSKAMANILPNINFQGYRDAALARSHADWLYGINMSRAVTISARKSGASSNYSVGRVQTPTLALVVNREDEIGNFVKEDHYKPWIRTLTPAPKFRAVWIADEDDVRLSSSGLLINKQEAEQIVKRCKQSGVACVKDHKSTEQNDLQPLPFSLSALQAHCSSIFKFSGTKTLNIAQSLYLLKIISYPRASCDYLPENQYLEAPGILTSLAKAALPTSVVSGLRGAKPSIKSRCWNDAEQESHGHHAIAPVILDNPTVIAGLTEEQKKVYFEIVKRYLLQFWPVAVFTETIIILESGNEIFKVTGKKYNDEGWKKAFLNEMPVEEKIDSDDEIVNISLPLLTKGQIVQLEDSGYDSLETKPPKRYTEGSLLTAMKNIHRYVVDPIARSRLKASAGIGTEATRADIIQGLLEKELIIVSKNYLFPSEKGSKLIHVLPRLMTSPDMTAMWEAFMERLLSSKSSYEFFIGEQKTWLKQLVASSGKFFEGIVFAKDPNAPDVNQTNFQCFSCNDKLVHVKYKGKSFFSCQSCKINFSDKDGTPQPKEQIEDSGIVCPTCKKHTVIRKSRTDKTGYFWTCRGWRPDKKGCNAVFSDKEGNPVFEKSKPSDGENKIKCPKCGVGHLFRILRKPPAQGHFWGCSSWRDGCDYKTEDSAGSPAPKSKIPTATPVTPLATPNRFAGMVSNRGIFSGGKLHNE